MTTQKLPLHDLWTAHHAQWKEEKGWLLPLRFEGLDKEYESAHHALGVIDQSYRTKIKVTGKDRADFLHRLLTNDIKSLKPGEGCYAAFLTATGKVLFDAVVLIGNDFILLDAEIGLEQKILTLLNKYIITDDVALTDETRSWVHLALVGPNVEAFLSNGFISPSALSLRGGQKSDEGISEGKPGLLRSLPSLAMTVHTSSFLIEGSAVWILELHTKNHPVYHLLIPSSSSQMIAGEIVKSGMTFGIKLVGYEASESLRIEAGHWRYSYDVDENVLLPETGLADLMASETKGCYPGQEVVARIKTYSGLKRQITKLIDPQNEPTTSLAFSPKLKKTIAIALLQITAKHS